MLETRSFQPVGDVVARKFEGKLIAATNRDLGLEIGRGRFREDLYYRLCADRIEAPGLAEQLRDRPETMRELVMFMARRAAGSEAAVLSEEVMAWMERELPAGYRWPGNYRELEQCVRNILIRRSYRPLVAERAGDEEDFYRRMKRGEARAAEVLGFYSAMVYGQCGSYEETARRIGLDRRTVKARVDEWLRVATVVG